jgi:hypothetical protein
MGALGNREAYGIAYLQAGLEELRIHRATPAGNLGGRYDSAEDNDRSEHSRVGQGTGCRGYF